MKKPEKHRILVNSENTTRLDPRSGPSSSELQFNRSHPLSGPKPTGKPDLNSADLNRKAALNAPPLAVNGGSQAARTPGKNNAPRGTESITQRDPEAGPTNSELQFNYSHPLSGPRPTGKPAILHLNRQQPVVPPPVAARGDDDVMSQPQKQS